VFPGATSVFAAIDSAISLTFLERFTTQAQADWLSPKRLGTWLSSVSYSGHTDPEILHARLLAAPQGCTGADAETHTVTTLAFVAILNRPRFLAHFLCWKDGRDVDQVRREHQGQSGAAGS